MSAARAAPYEKGTETGDYTASEILYALAARAAPYEKGTETPAPYEAKWLLRSPRARPPMRRGLKRGGRCLRCTPARGAARAAPYEKGTETSCTRIRTNIPTSRRARGPL